MVLPVGIPRVPRLPFVPGADKLAAAPEQIIRGARDLLASGFRSIVSGEPSGQPEWIRELADGVDEGYFGPESAAWTVNGSLPTLVGGIRALLVQALHPAALAGVMQHSRYDDDPLGRLAGTARWITVTTFGDTHQAERESARVRGLHRKVAGSYLAPDGQQVPYSASDPDLLRWVHLAFTDSFLATYRVWGGEVPGGGEDAYVREWAVAGELVGVADAPRSVAELAEQLRRYDAALRYDEATAEIVRFIQRSPLPLAARPSYGVLFAGAVATLPDRYRRLLGLPPIPLVVTKPAVQRLLAGLGLVVGHRSPSASLAMHRIERLRAGESTPPDDAGTLNA